LEQLHSPQRKVEDIVAARSKVFASDITDKAIKPLLQIFNPDRELDVKWQEQLKNLAEKAYIWSHKVNTSFFQYDFHPLWFPFGETFDPHNMKREGASRIRTTGQILACVGMGLKTSAAKGSNREPEEVVQVQVPIVTDADI
jgi:hypothetical protein